MRTSRLFRSTFLAAALVATSLGVASPAHATVTCPTSSGGALSPAPTHDGSTDWSGCAFTASNFPNAFTDTDFSGIKLDGAVIDGDATSSGLTGFDFTDASLKGTTFNCVNSNWQEDGQRSNMANVVFTGADATGATFNGCGMNSIIVHGPSLANPAIFESAHFNATYDEAYEGTWVGNINYSDLSGVSFLGATFGGIDISWNQIDGTSFDTATFQPSQENPDFGASLGDLSYNYLSDGFDAATGDGPNLTGVTAIDTYVFGNDFRNGNLYDSNFYSNQLPNADGGGPIFGLNLLTGANVNSLTLNSLAVDIDIAGAGDPTVDGLSITNSVIGFSDFSDVTYTNSDFSYNTFALWGGSGCSPVVRAPAPKGCTPISSGQYSGAADFSGTTFTSGKFDGVANTTDSGSIGPVDFTSANLEGASIQNASIDGFVFRGADLKNAVFHGTMFRGVTDFHGADLTDATFTDATFISWWRDGYWNGDSAWGPDFSGATMAGTDVTDVELYGAVSGGIVGTPTGLASKYVLTGESESMAVGGRGYIVGPNVNLSHAELQMTNLDHVDLRGAALIGTNFLYADLRGANLEAMWGMNEGLNLRGADLTGGRLRGSSLFGVILKDTQLVDADLTETNTFGAEFDGTNLGGADLSKATLDGSTLTNVDLRAASLHWTSMDNVTLATSNANLAGVESSHIFGTPKSLPSGWTLTRKMLVGPGANDSYASLYGSDFHGRNLAGLRARYSDLTDTNFNSADLTGAKLDFADLEGSTFTSAVLTGVSAAGANAPGVSFGAAATVPAFAAQYGGSIRLASAMAGASLRGANLKGATFTEVDLSGADFSGANLKGAGFSGTSLNNADLSGANLQGSSFTGTNLSGADLSGADLGGADLKGANLAGAHLGNTNLSGVDLTGVNLTGVDTSGVTWGTAKCNDGIAASLHVGGRCPVTAPPGTKSQTKFSLPKTVKRGKTIKLAAKTRQGVAVTVRASGKCSVTKTTAKVKGKRVTTGYTVKVKSVKGICTVTVLSVPSGSYATLFQQKLIKVV